MFELLVIVFIVMSVSATCSMVEAVLYSLSTSAIDTMEKQGKTTGKIFKKFRENIQRPISAILALNTIANTAGAAVSGAVAAKVLGNNWLGLFSALLTFGILIFSEILPKTFGVTYNRLLSYPAARIIWLLVKVMSPLLWIIHHLTSRLLPKSGESSAVSPEEIVSMVNLGRKGGLIERHEEKVIENILFLDQKKVKDIMTPRTVIVSLPGDITLQKACELSQNWPHSRVPVYGDHLEDIVGIVLCRDVLLAMFNGKGGQKISELMRPVHFVPNNITLNALLLQFFETKQHIFMVVDEFGGIDGLVTFEDVIEEILGEEIIGEADRAVDMRQLARERRNRRMAGKNEPPQANI